MPIITISRGSYSRGKEVAERVAERLGYECVSREIILEASREFNVAEVKLIRALHDPASFFERISHGRDRYMKYFRSALLNHLKKDNVVYHGLAGHFLIQDVSHSIKVRIIADMRDRVREEMKRENIDARTAFELLRKDDEERRKWGEQIYGMDTWDSRLYDLVINVKSITIEDAVDVLVKMSGKPVFQTTEESRENLNRAALMAEIEAKIVDYAPLATASLENGVLSLFDIGDQLKNSKGMRQRLSERLIGYKGIKEISFDKPESCKKNYINTFHNICP